jgi:hypothetical protein
MQNRGIKCWLRYKSSYIHGVKEIYGFGKYFCISNSCRNIFSVKISKDAYQSDVVIEVFWENQKKHEKLFAPPERICATSRMQLGYKLLAKGTKNIKYERICANKRKSRKLFVF